MDAQLAIVLASAVSGASALGGGLIGGWFGERNARQARIEERRTDEIRHGRALDASRIERIRPACRSIVAAAFALGDFAGGAYLLTPGGETKEERQLRLDARFGQTLSDAKIAVIDLAMEAGTRDVIAAYRGLLSKYDSFWFQVHVVEGVPETGSTQAIWDARDELADVVARYLQSLELSERQ